VKDQAVADVSLDFVAPVIRPLFEVCGCVVIQTIVSSHGLSNRVYTYFKFRGIWSLLTNE
jgi:hypothetical protein